MNLRYCGMPSELAAAYRAGAPDAYGLMPERHISDGDGVPCRHCLGSVGAGEPYLILAYRPFPEPQPYAETGPIFLHAEDCPAHDPSGGMPQRVRESGSALILRGYDERHRIVYGTGVVVKAGEIEEKARAILGRDDVAYLHMRSATNNCFTLRIELG